MLDFCQITLQISNLSIQHPSHQDIEQNVWKRSHNPSPILFSNRKNSKWIVLNSCWDCIAISFSYARTLFKISEAVHHSYISPSLYLTPFALKLMQRRVPWAVQFIPRRWISTHPSPPSPPHYLPSITQEPQELELKISGTKNFISMVRISIRLISRIQLRPETRQRE